MTLSNQYSRFQLVIYIILLQIHLQEKHVLEFLHILFDDLKVFLFFLEIFLLILHKSHSDHFNNIFFPSNIIDFFFIWVCYHTIFIMSSFTIFNCWWFIHSVSHSVQLQNKAPVLISFTISTHPWSQKGHHATWL